MAAPPPSVRRDPVPLGGRLPLGWKLPLVVCALVAASLVLVLVLTYLTLRWREEETVSDRLEYATRFIAEQARVALDARLVQARAVGRMAAVRSVLAAAPPPAADAPRGTPVAVASLDDSARAATVRRALGTLLPTDSLTPVELWDASGRPVASAGPPLADRATAPTVAEVEAASRDDDGAYLGPFRADARGVVGYWTVVPIRPTPDGRSIGYLALPRRVNAPTQALATLRGLLSDSVTLSVRNVDDSRWVSAGADVTGPPAAREGGAYDLRYVRAGEPRLAAEADIPGTPWGVVLESPARWAAQRPMRTMRILALVGLGVTLLVGAVAWIVARRLARPLAALTVAAEGVARGDYDRPVSGAGADEVGRLATSFDAMARQVTTARHELERRAADAQAARAEAERARAEAEQASRAKSDFLAVMSHELRTPLNAITGYAQLVDLGVHGPVTDAQRDALGRIARSGTHLLGLINDVLSFARVDAGQVRFAKADVRLADVLAEVDALVQPQARAAGVTLVHAPLPDDAACVRADHDKLCQVLLNLLANAVKYTPPGGSVTVAAERAGDRVRVHVRDTGVGIAPEKLAAVFEPFVQGERALNRPHEGVGLGLAIARDFARGMDGDVTAASMPGAGSTFTVTLPAATADAAVTERSDGADGLARAAR